MISSQQSLNFKFRYVKNGQPVNIFSKKGSASDVEIVLGEDRVKYEAVLDTKVRDNRMVLVLNDFSGLTEKTLKKALVEGLLVLELGAKQARELANTIDRIGSAKSAERSRAELEKAGEKNLFRTFVCPKCGATVDLSKLEMTQYVYCRYCESLFNRSGEMIDDGEKYRACDECGMFDSVKGYTEFYFYFLVIVYGFRYKRRFVCTNCANKLFWKTLLINLIFVLGVIPAIWLKIKSMIGRDQRFMTLTQANKLSVKGKYTEAAALYQQIYIGLPEHPGILMNEAIANIIGNNPDFAMSLIKRSLSSCANYMPTLLLINKLQQAAQTNSAGQQMN